MWYVYALRCQNKDVYIGSTNDLRRRWNEHNLGKCYTTKHNKPIRIEFYIAVRTEQRARELEKYLKTGSGKAVYRKRILSDEA